MNTSGAFRTTLILWGGVLTFFIEVGLSGCTSSIRQPYEKEVRHEDVGWNIWNEGMNAFWREDYAEARNIFESLSLSAKDEELSRKVLYALACTRMILAKNPEEFREAMELWELWSQSAFPPRQEEDPRMMAPLLQYIAPPHVLDGPFDETTVPCSDEVCRKFFQIKEQEIQHLKKRVKSLDSARRKALEKLEKKEKSRPVDDNKEYQMKEYQNKENQLKESQKLLRAKETEIRKLKKQIEALEAIHRNIQEKKKKVTSSP